MKLARAEQYRYLKLTETAFLNWKAQTGNFRDKRENNEKARAFANLMRKETAMKRWKKFVTIYKAKRESKHAVESYWRDRTLNRCFKAWNHYSTQKHLLKRKLFSFSGLSVTENYQTVSVEVIQKTKTAMWNEWKVQYQIRSERYDLIAV